MITKQASWNNERISVYTRVTHIGWWFIIQTRLERLYISFKIKRKYRIKIFITLRFRINSNLCLVIIYRLLSFVFEKFSNLIHSWKWSLSQFNYYSWYFYFKSYNLSEFVFVSWVLDHSVFLGKHNYTNVLVYANFLY